MLAGGDGPVRVDQGGDLVISPLTAEDVPAEAVSLKAELNEMLPVAPIVSLLIELDKPTGYLDRFTHASGKQTRTPELKSNLIAVLLAHSTNLGLRQGFAPTYRCLFSTRAIAGIAVADIMSSWPASIGWLCTGPATYGVQFAAAFGRSAIPFGAAAK